MMKKILFSFILFSMLVWVSSAFAYSFGFQDIPDDEGIDISSNFSGDISESNGQILFTISNNGPVDSHIRSIYWEYTPDDLLTGGAYDASHETEVAALGGVDFIFDANLNNPPQGNSIGFISDSEANAQNPGGSGKNGVDVGETAAFLFNGDFNTVIAALENGSLRIAIHVQGIDVPGDFGSDSYYNKPLGVPEPEVGMFFGFVLLGLGFVYRKRAQG